MSTIHSVAPALGMLSALTLSTLYFSAMASPPPMWGVEGTYGTAGADGVVSAPPGGGSYHYLISSGTTSGLGLGLGEEMNGSCALWSFSANAGDRLELAFNYVTTDGGDFTDYA